MRLVRRAFTIRNRNVFTCRFEDLTRDDDTTDITRPVCLVAVETKQDVNSLKTGLSRLLEIGASYFCCYGPNATELHAKIDDLIVTLEFESEDSVIPTVGESSDGIDKTVDFFANAALPSSDVNEFDYLVVVKGSTEFENRLLRVIEKAAFRGVN